VRRLRLHVAEEAARELRAARSWWRANCSAAPATFTDDLRRAMELIRTQPRAGVRATNVRLPGVRWIQVRRTRAEPKGLKVVAQLFRVETNAVANAKSWQFAALDESVDAGAAEPQQSCHLGDG